MLTKENLLKKSLPPPISCKGEILDLLMENKIRMTMRECMLTLQESRKKQFHKRVRRSIFMDSIIELRVKDQQIKQKIRRRKMRQPRNKKMVAVGRKSLNSSQMLQLKNQKVRLR